MIKVKIGALERTDRASLEIGGGAPEPTPWQLQGV